MVPFYFHGRERVGPMRGSAFRRCYARKHGEERGTRMNGHGLEHAAGDPCPGERIGVV